MENNYNVRDGQHRHGHSENLRCPRVVAENPAYKANYNYFNAKLLIHIVNISVYFNKVYVILSIIFFVVNNVMKRELVEVVSQVAGHALREELSLLNVFENC